MFLEESKGYLKAKLEALTKEVENERQALNRYQQRQAMNWKEAQKGKSRQRQYSNRASVPSEKHSVQKRHRS